jgi:hypothetical protein
LSGGTFSLGGFERKEEGGGWIAELLITEELSDKELDNIETVKNECIMLV